MSALTFLASFTQGPLVRGGIVIGLPIRYFGIHSARAGERLFAYVIQPKLFSSTLNRNKVGINYTGQQNPLSGCVNDAKDIYQFLIGLPIVCPVLHVFDITEKTEQYRFAHSNIVLLTDADANPDPRSKPTRENLLNAMRWLVEDAHPDDALFVHCE